MEKRHFWNRENKCYVTEKVFGEDALEFLYSPALMSRVANFILTKKIASQLYGFYYESPVSAHRIESFVKNFDIALNEFEEKKYQTFNDFFIRKFKPQSRSFIADKNSLPAFAEGKYLAFDKVSSRTPLPVKNATLCLEQLLNHIPESKDFIGGPCFIARLSLSDYHRFHFIDDGKIQKTFQVSGDLQSVNPIAYRNYPELLFRNYRSISLLKTIHFGRVAMIEVGALTVGKIIQFHQDGFQFHRGEEKGYFKIGGSTVILIGEKDSFFPDADLLEQTNKGFETLVKLGSRIGSK